ncbi:sensor domain-containing protein [Pelagibacterium montanilacus]|uniref:sensor domain-containing protein n=1 Tax=Pelagibacterium montanilacus TaxID=2185280 RepID=UPI0013DEAF58|nr:EAL domain-containing protein [Pelagibacterium montanilacus]
MSTELAKFEMAFDLWPAPAMLLDRNLVITACNQAYEHAARHDRTTLIGRNLFEAFPGSGNTQAAILQNSFQRVLRTQKTDHLADIEYAVASPDGSQLDSKRWTVSNVPLFSETGELVSILHCPLEIPDLEGMTGTESVCGAPNLGIPELAQPTARQLVTVLDVERKRLQHLFHQAPGFICVLEGPRHSFELANAAYYQLVGHREIIGHPLADVLPEVVEQGFLEKLDQVYKTGKPFIGRAMPIELQRVAGGALELKYIDLIYQPIVDETQNVTGIFVQGNDVTEAYTLAQEVAHQAAHDSLTGLINRREFSRLTEDIVSEGPHALLYLDIDHFKIVNDRCGHAAGDSLLKEVTLQLDAFAGEDMIIARLGGDEFAVVQSNCDVAAATALADRLRAAVKGISFVWGEQRYSVSLSIGVAIFSVPEGATFEMALGHADAACFLAKEAGRDRTKVALASDAEVGRQRCDMDNVTRLQQAVRENRIELFGQQIQNLQSYRSDASKFVEVLARLRDVSGRLISPAGFIPAAERFGLIEELDRHIISKAIAHLDSNIIHPGTCYFINLSAVTLSSDSFFAYVVQLLEEKPQFLTAHICFEVTETQAISNIGRSAAAMRKLADLGIRFALDDFGSGMASFAYLQQLPVHFVKIDGEFVKSVSSNPASAIIVESVVKLATSMGIQTVAESVEFAELTPVLQRLGVNYAQGYAVHRPEPLCAAVLGADNAKLRVVG